MQVTADMTINGKAASSLSQTASRACVLIAAGGTGGHIMPALSVGAALQRLAPGWRVIYACGRRPQEREWYEQAGVTPFDFPVSPIQGGVFSKVASVWTLGECVWRSRALVTREKVDAVLGMGGYVSAPACVAAALMRRPVLIHEQNAVLGRANRRIAPWACLVAGAYPSVGESLPAGRFRWTGNPVRPGFGQVRRDEGRRRLGLDLNRPALAITGGSQGALSLNAFVGRALRSLDASGAGRGWQVVWACGHRGHEACLKDFAPESFKEMDVRVTPFVQEMDCLLAAVDCVVARAGASTLAEVALCATPSILFPLRSAINDHQRLNAQAMVEAGAARALSEHEADPEELVNELTALMGDESRRSRMSRSARTLARPKAAEALARLVMDAVKDTGR